MHVSAERTISYLAKQPCVIAVRKADLPPIMKAEAELFIHRNILPDCGRVPPNCFKAFLIKTAQRMGLRNIVPSIHHLFRANVGFNGYYLDGGQLKRIDATDNFFEARK
jgi:hypothetical protein